MPPETFLTNSALTKVENLHPHFRVKRDKVFYVSKQL